jgi:hypothetical protein
MILGILISKPTTDYTDNTDGFETDFIRANPGLIRGRNSVVSVRLRLRRARFLCG